MPRRLLKFWRNLSITTKLYLVVGVMASLIITELIILQLAMHTLSAARAFVGGESLWSKAQKNAVLSLQRFARTRDQRDYDAFLGYLKIPEGDHRARVELSKPKPDYKVVFDGFVEGELHPEDIAGMVRLLERFYWVSYIGEAISIWTQADGLLEHMRIIAEEYYAVVRSPVPNEGRTHALMAEIKSINDRLTPLQARFSSALGDGSRWLENLILSMLLMAVVAIEMVGLTLTFLTTRSLSRGLKDLVHASERIGKGDFAHRLPVKSGDELGLLSSSVNKMGEMLEGSYRQLESRVQERTAELSKLAMENERLYEETKGALATRDVFLSMASHELRTPFTSLYLQMQMLQRLLKQGGVVDSPAARELTSGILSQSRRYAGLLDQLLDLTRLQNGKYELKREPADLRLLVEQAVDQLRPDASARRVELKFQAENVLGSFDPTRIGQLTTNLVSNALKYGEGKPIEVAVWAKGERGYVSVRDHGAGVPPEEQDRIFECFERGHGDPNVSGLGLGLYICRQIVSAHGGEITLQSRPGDGTTFTAALELRAG